MKVKFLRQRNPRYRGVELDEHRALHEGGDEWRARLDTWLPRQEAEPDDRHKLRKKLATYMNHAGALVDMIAAWLFAEPAIVEGLPETAYYKALLTDVDKSGSKWADWWKERFVDALVGGRAYAWVELPAVTDEFASRADQEAAGALDAYLVGLTPEDVIDWGYDAHGALAWVMIEQVASSRDGPGSARRRTWKWTYIDSETVQTWTWTPPPERPDDEPDDDEDVADGAKVAHNFGRLPVVELEMPVGLYAMRKLRDPAVAHIRGRHDLDWWLNRCAHSMLVVKRAGIGDGEAPLVGQGYYIEAGPDDDISWTEPPGNAASILADDIKARLEELYRVVQAMALSVDGNAARSNMSGESKRQDWQALDIILAAYADLVHDVMRKTLAVVAAARRDDLGDGVTTKGLDGWQNEDLATWLDSAVLAAPLIPSQTFKKFVAKRTVERLGGDDLNEADRAAIFKEIDEAPDDPAPYVAPPRPGQNPPQPKQGAP